MAFPLPATQDLAVNSYAVKSNSTLPQVTFVMPHFDQSYSGFILAFYPDIQPELTPSFVRSRLLAAASCQELMCCLVILRDHHSSA